MIACKVMMDRDAPPGLMDTAQRGYDLESKALIERWRGRARLDYAITPWFAVTSTKADPHAVPVLRARISALLRPYRCRREQGRDRPRRGQPFPEAKSYIDVYAQVGPTRIRRCSATASTA